jgi:hypothetical protein
MPPWRWVKIFESALSVIPEEQRKRSIGGRTSPRSCRFCLREAPLATFRCKAHVVAEAFGNRSLFSLDECDDCNQLGSKYEDDLARLLLGSRLIARAPSKKNSVTHKSRRSAARIDASRSTGLAIRFDPDDRDIRIQLTDDGFKLSTRQPSYCPANVVRALARMGFFALPAATCRELEHIRRWLQREFEWPSSWFSMFSLNGEGVLGETILQVYVPDEEGRGSYPPLHVRFSFGRSMVVAQIPGPDWKRLPTVIAPGGTAILAPPGEVFDDNWYEVEFYSPELAAKARPSHEAIAREAYFEFQARGCAHGRDTDDWIVAEQRLLWARYEAHELETDGAPNKPPPLQGPGRSE